MLCSMYSKLEFHSSPLIYESPSQKNSRIFALCNKRTMEMVKFEKRRNVHLIENYCRCPVEHNDGKKPPLEFSLVGVATEWQRVDCCCHPGQRASLTTNQSIYFHLNLKLPFFFPFVATIGGGGGAMIVALDERMFPMCNFVLDCFFSTSPANAYPLECGKCIFCAKRLKISSNTIQTKHRMWRVEWSAHIPLFGMWNTFCHGMGR